MAVVDEDMDRQQLDRGHAQRLDVVDHVLGAQARVGAAQLLGHRGMQLGEALDMRLIDDRVDPTAPALRSRLTLPIEVRIDHHALRHERRAVALIEGQCRLRDSIL